MRLIKNPLVIIALVALVGLVALGIYQARKVEIAHSTFENYYAFRGCVQLIDKTDTAAHCELANGQSIELVAVDNKWYLDGDLPVCYGTFCL